MNITSVEPGIHLSKMLSKLMDKVLHLRGIKKIAPLAQGAQVAKNVIPHR